MNDQPEVKEFDPHWHTWEVISWMFRRAYQLVDLYRKVPESITVWENKKRLHDYMKKAISRIIDRNDHILECLRGDNELALYEMLDHDKDKIRVWLSGDQEQRWGWECFVRPLTNGEYAYQLEQHFGNHRAFNYHMRGSFKQPYMAIEAAIIEFELITQR